MQTQQHTQNVNMQHLVTQYLQRGNSVTVCAAKRATGIRYFALTCKASKHAGKANYGRSNKRYA